MAKTTLQKLEAVMEEKANAYVKSYNDGAKRKELKELKKAAAEAIDAYNLENEMTVYKSWAEESNPVQTAIRLRYVPNAKKAKYKIDDDDYMTLEWKPLEYLADLPMIEYTVGNKWFANKDWFDMAECLAFEAAGRINDRILEDPKFVYEVRNNEKKFFEGIDFMTDEGFQTALNKVFDAILFIDNPVAPGQNVIKAFMKTNQKGEEVCPYWEVIRDSMTKEGGVSAIEICNTSRFMKYILDAMHTISTNGNLKVKVEKYNSVLKDKKADKTKTGKKDDDAKPDKAKTGKKTGKKASKKDDEK